MDLLESSSVRPRQARYQAALRPDMKCITILGYFNVGGYSNPTVNSHPRKESKTPKPRHFYFFCFSRLAFGEVFLRDAPLPELPGSKRNSRTCDRRAFSFTRSFSVPTSISNSTGDT